MTDQNKDQVVVMNEKLQTSQTSTADIAAASNKSSADITRASAHPVAGERVTGTTGPAPLLTTNDTADLHSRWTDVQAGFVDEPRASVEKADALVAEVMKRVAEKFATERSGLESQWSRGADVSTEELRVALQHYRSFFDRLLSL